MNNFAFEVKVILSMKNTFTDELNPNSMGGFLQRFATNYPAFRQIAPFIRTPYNIASNVSP